MLDAKQVYPSEPITFSIDERTYSLLKDSARTKQGPLAEEDWDKLKFGGRYIGNFVIRVPSLGDQAEVAKLHAIRMASQGSLDQTMLDQEVRIYEYIFALVEICSAQKPAWFDRTKLWLPLDRTAVLEVNFAFNEKLLELKKKYEEPYSVTSTPSPTTSSGTV